MKRILVLPVSAAVIGSLLAVGVFAGTRKAKDWAKEQHFYAVEVAEQVEVQLEGSDLNRDVVGGEGPVTMSPEDLRVDGERLNQVLEDVRVQMRAAVESNRDLTDADRARIREALQRIEAKLPFSLNLDARIEINGEKLVIRSSADASDQDVTFELDIQAPELPVDGGPPAAEPTGATEPAGN